MVIESTLEKIYRKYGYTFDEEVIDKLGEAVKYFFRQEFQEKTFMKCVRDREGTRDFDRRFPQLKIQQKSASDHHLPSSVDLMPPRKINPNFMIASPTLARLYSLPFGREAGTSNISQARQHYYELAAHRAQPKKKTVQPVTGSAPEATEDEP